jgi:ADP-ribose pyrophosphatase YjhB (NUDIX family)
LVVWAQGPEPEWALPGGGIELGETAEQCAIREVFEETGFHAQVDRILGVLDEYIPVEKRLSSGDRPLHLHQVIYEGRVTGGALNPDSDAGHEQAAWIDLATVSSLPRVFAVDHALYLSGYGSVLTR